MSPHINQCLRREQNQSQLTTADKVKHKVFAYQRTSIVNGQIHRHQWPCHQQIFPTKFSDHTQTNIIKIVRKMKLILHELKSLLGKECSTMMQSTGSEPKDVSRELVTRDTHHSPQTGPGGDDLTLSISTCSPLKKVRRQQIPSSQGQYKG